MWMRRMNRGRSITAKVVAILSLWVTVSPTVAADLPEILDQVSDNPAIVVVVPNMAQLSDKVAQLATVLGIHDNPQMNDLLGQLKQEAGFINGVQDDGSLAVVFPDINEAIEQDRDPSVVMLVPVSDYKAFVENFEGDASQPVAELTMKYSRKGYAKKMGGYAVFGDARAKDAVAEYQAGGSSDQIAKVAGHVGTRCLTSSDAAVIVNVAKMAPKLQDLLDQGMEEIHREFEADKDDPQFQQFVPVASMAIEAYEKAARAVLRDTQSLVIGLDLNVAGIGVSQTIQFKTGSYLASLFPGGGGAAGQLAKIADQPYLIAQSLDLRGLAIDKLIDELLAVFPDTQEGDGQIAKLMGDVKGILSDSAELLRTVKGGAVAYLPPNDPAAMGMGQSIFRGVNIYETDGKIDGEMMPKIFESYNNLLQQMHALAGDDQPQIAYDVTYTPNVMEIEGVSVDQYQVQIQYPPEMMQQMGPMMPFMAMMGATGQTGYYAATDDHMIMTTVPDPQLVKQALVSIKDNKGLGTQGPIQKLRAESLPTNPAVEFYVSVGGFVDTASMFMGMMMGQPLPVEAPDDLPPVAWAMSVEGSGLVGRMYVPVAILEFGRETYDQTMLMMMGGGATADGGSGGGRGTGGPPPAPN